MRQRWQASLAFDVIRASEGGRSNDGEDGVIHGSADGEMKTEMKGNIRGANFNQTSKNTGIVNFAIEAKEQSPDFQFQNLELKRTEGPIDFHMSQTIKSADSTAVDTGTAAAGKYGEAHTSAASHGKSLERDVNGNAGGTSASDDSKRKVTWFVLSVEQRTCATMIGKIDSHALEARLKSSGMSGTVVDSNWDATYDGRDIEFEQQVSDLVRRVPNPPNISALKYLTDKFVALRGKPDAASNYRLCVLQPLMERLIQVSLSLMRREVTRVQQIQFTRFEDLSPSLLTTMQALQFLQFLGAAN